MPSVSSLIEAHEHGSAGSLRALGEALSAALSDTPSLPSDPVDLWDAVETSGAEAAGTWQEVRAARDRGDLTDAEYDYLAAAVALREDTQ